MSIKTKIMLAMSLLITVVVFAFSILGNGNQKLSLPVSFLLWVFFLLLSIPASVLLSKSITLPISKLKGAVERAAEGNFEQSVKVKGGKEIESLSMCFDVMLSVIDDTIGDLRQSRENLATTLNSIADAVIVTDAGGLVTRLNPVAESLTGRSLEETRGRPLSDVFLFEDARSGELAENPVEAVIRTGEVVGLNSQSILKSHGGKECRVAHSAAPIRNLKGDIIGVVLVFRDVSEEYAVCERTKRSETNLRQIIDLLPHLLYVKNREGRFLLANKAVANSLGTTVETLTGKLHSDVHPDPSEIERIMKDELLVLESGRMVEVPEECHYDSDDTPRWRSTIKVPFRAAKTNESAILVLSMDISRQKNAEEALNRRIVTLTQPMTASTEISFTDLFNVDEIQQVQDAFAEATGVASLITTPGGVPITKPSKFCRLCRDIIRKTSKGLANCYYSDAMLGRYNPSGPIVQPCRSAGLWDGGASITAGKKHIANWLVGQVRNDQLSEDKMLDYAREIGADVDEFRTALREVTAMPLEQFEAISKALFILANQLSSKAYQNIQQARFLSEQKKTEGEMRKLRNYLSNIIDSMPSVLVGVDALGNVTQWNRQAEQETGITAKDAAGRKLVDVLPHLAAEMDKIHLAMTEEKTQRDSKKPRHLKDQLRYEDVTVYPLISNGAKGAVIRIDDVTRYVRLEEMMIQSEKMLSVGGLAAGMAHEINNPLAGIMQNAFVLINRLTGKIPANLRAAEQCGTDMDTIRAFMEKRGVIEQLEMIRESGSRAATIVSNMLNFARKSESKFAPHHMGELLDKTISLAESDYDLKKKYDFRKIEILRKYEPDLPEVPCEASKIQQVFLNILKNGAEAMNEHLRKMNVNDNIDGCPEKPTFWLRVLREQDMVRVEIEDNGPGMDPAVCKRIFEPFFTTKSVGVGTGLGLSVSYFIITENHRGTMRVDSTPGQGTMFIIRLPLRRTTPAL